MGAVEKADVLEMIQAEISRGLEILWSPGGVHEARIPNTSRATVSGYFDDPAKLTTALQEWDGDAPGLYVTLNSCKPALLARAANRLVHFAKFATTDDLILHRRWFPLDFDPVRPSGISSTDGEHAAALDRARIVRDWLAGEGWPDGVLIDSGNGGHLLYRVDVPNDAAALALVTRALEALAFRFSDGVVSVDLGVANAGRIWKIPGTMVRKGDATPDRPHRRSCLLDVPDPLTIVPRDLLEALAAQAPPKETAAPGRNGQGALDVAAWIARVALPVERTGPWNGGTRWVLSPCPFDEAHTNGSAYIVQFPSGAVAAGCHHNGCAGKNWQTLRDLMGPGGRNGHSEACEGGRPQEAQAGSAGAHESVLDAARPTAHRAAGRLLVTRLADVQSERVTWLWPGRVPQGKLTVFIGDPGEGKSMITQGMAAYTTTGAHWPDGGRPPVGNVIILSAEDGTGDTIKPRIEAAGGDTTRVFVVDGVSHDDTDTPALFNLSRDLAALERLVEEQTAALVIIDPISAYLGGVDSWKDSAVRGVLGPVAALADRQRVAIVGILHLTKATDRRAIARGQGNIAMVAAARSVFGVSSDAEDPARKYLMPLKTNLATTPPVLAFRIEGVTLPGGIDSARLVWEPQPVQVDIEAVMAGPGQRAGREGTPEADTFLRALLEEGPVKSTAIYRDAKANGFGGRTMERAKVRLGVVAERIGGIAEGGAWFWRLPDPAPKAATTDPKAANGENVAALAQVAETNAITTPTSSKAATSPRVAVLGGDGGGLRQDVGPPQRWDEV